MSNINFLYDEYKKDPEKIEKLLSSKVTIEEKLDASRFSVQINEKGEFVFYKRKDVIITKIDRTIAKYYEKAIFHFENLPEEKKDLLPVNWKFGMEYFPNHQPVVISYDRLPLNNLVLTDIQVKDPKDKTIDIITDKETLYKWANILEVEKPPIIFEGELSVSQKNKILNFLNTPYTSLISRFKTENFTRFILTLLNPQLKSSFLNNDIDKDIDGLIFKFDGKEALKVSNPEIIISKSKPRDEQPSDIYNLTLVILQEFITSLDFKKIKLKEKRFEDRYIEFICKIFNMFVKSPYYKKNFVDNVDFELPKFLTREDFKLNFKFISDPETQELLNKSNTNRELFKILLVSMRTHKKKSSGFFTKELLHYHNKLVDKIADYINSDLKESFFTFEEFKSVFIGESNSWQHDFGKDADEETEKIEFSNTVEIKKNPIDVFKKIYSDSEEKPKSVDVCLMKGKFFPFHNGHVSSTKDAYIESGKKVFLAITLKSKDFKELHKSILDDVIKNEKHIIGYEFIDGMSMKEIEDLIPFNIKYFSGNENECEDVKIQNPNVQTIISTQHSNSNSILQKIKDEDYNSYRKLTPNYLHNYFYKIKNEIK